MVDGDEKSAMELLSEAYRLGIRTFDTADIYGQGRSERLIGRFIAGIRREDVVIITKVGQVFPLYLRLLSPFRGIAQWILRHRSGAKDFARQIRKRELPRDLSRRHIETGVRSSLRRLNTDFVDAVLLHSPTSKLLSGSDALECLVELKRAQKIKLIGISCDDVETAALAVADPRVEIIQIPISTKNRAFAEVARAARSRGVIVVGREVLGGVRGSSELKLSAEEARQAVQSTLDEGDVDLVLVGTTSAGRLSRLVSSLTIR